MSTIVPKRQLMHLPASLRPVLAASLYAPLRLYATQTGLGTTTGGEAPRRKKVTVMNDDGRVAWGQLSPMEKAARTTQQSFNLGLIVVGAVMTGGVAYLMYTEVFALDSSTNQFNYAVNRVKKDERCLELLGPANKIKAFGEDGGRRSNWRVVRPIASKTSTDGRGTEHMIMHFNVEGTLNSGVVNLHLVKGKGEGEWVYRYLALDVKGHQRLYLENSEGKKEGKAGSGKIFGVSWR